MLRHSPVFARLQARELAQLRVVCGVVAGLMLGFSGTVWDYAVIADTRVLSLLLFTAALALVTRWMLTPGERRFLGGAFFAFGLLLTNGQEFLVAMPGLLIAIMLARADTGRDVTLLIMPLALFLTPETQYTLWLDELWNPNMPMVTAVCGVGCVVLTLTAITRRVGTEWKSALVSGLGFLLGFGFYLYLPIASMTTPPVNWGYARTLEGYLHVIRVGQYERLHPTPFSEPARYVAQLGDLASSAGKHFGWLNLLLSLIPFFYIRRMSPMGRRWLLGLLLVWFCVVLVLLAELNPPPDRQAWKMIARYFSAGYVIHAICLGVALMIVGARFTTPHQIQSPESDSPEPARKHEADDPGSYSI